MNAGYDKQRAAHALDVEKADMVSFGTSFISNSDLPYRLQHDKKLAAFDQNTFYTADAVGYTDYPFYEG